MEVTREAGDERVPVELRWKCGEPVSITPVDVGVGAEMLLDVVEPWKKIPPGVLLLAAAYVSVAVPVGYADHAVEIVDTAAPVGKAGREDPWGRVTQRLGRGTSRIVVTIAGLTPKVL